jgi:hypothetical protein
LQELPPLSRIKDRRAAQSTASKTGKEAVQRVDNTGIQHDGAEISGARVHGLPSAGAGCTGGAGSDAGDLSGSVAGDRCPPGFEKQWLARIAANKAKDYLRSAWVRKMNTPGDEVLALEGAPPGMQPEQQVLEALGEEELTGMILNLREPYCTPCRLVLLEQHTMAEAARLCGRPPKTVEAQVYRAKKMLAQQILQNDRIPCERRSVHGTV